MFHFPCALVALLPANLSLLPLTTVECKSAFCGRVFLDPGKTAWFLFSCFVFSFLYAFSSIELKETFKRLRSMYLNAIQGILPS